MLSNFKNNLTQTCIISNLSKTKRLSKQWRCFVFFVNLIVVSQLCMLNSAALNENQHKQPGWILSKFLLLTTIQPPKYAGCIVKQWIQTHHLFLLTP